jgi:hypothetical protein
MHHFRPWSLLQETHKQNSTKSRHKFGIAGNSDKTLGSVSSSTRLKVLVALKRAVVCRVADLEEDDDDDQTDDDRTV